MGLSFAAPLAGRDVSGRHGDRRDRHFNPRAPCGVRQSISGAHTRRLLFQSTHPLRGATQTCRSSSARSGFQSTRPLRGATVRHTHRPRDDAISIHAPLAGCDQRIWREVEALSEFQSTHPLRGATRIMARMKNNVRISIHAPLAGCDTNSVLFKTLPSAFQSTHPLRGATCGKRKDIVITMYFNPRTPCGVRRLHLSSTLVMALFQSTHPLRGATFHVSLDLLARFISIHAPLAGCD